MTREEKLANMFTIMTLIRGNVANILVKAPKDKAIGLIQYFEGLSTNMWCQFTKIKDDLFISFIVLGRKIDLLIQESDVDSFTYMQNVQY